MHGNVYKSLAKTSLQNMNRVVMVNKVSSLLLALRYRYIIVDSNSMTKNYGEAHINNTHAAKQISLLKPSATN